MEEPAAGIRHLRSVGRDDDDEVTRPVPFQSPDLSPDAGRPISRVILQSVLEENLAPLRQSIARLEAARIQDEGQIAELRARLDHVDARGQAHRADLEQAFDLVGQQLASVGQAAHLAEHHEEMINRLRDENVHGAASLQRINEEQVLILNQLMTRISGVQVELGSQRQRIKGLLIAVGSTALAVAAVIFLLIALYFLP